MSSALGSLKCCAEAALAPGWMEETPRREPAQSPSLGPTWKYAVSLATVSVSAVRLSGPRVQLLPTSGSEKPAPSREVLRTDRRTEALGPSHLVPLGDMPRLYGGHSEGKGNALLFAALLILTLSSGDEVHPSPGTSAPCSPWFPGFCPSTSGKSIWVF